MLMDIDLSNSQNEKHKHKYQGVKEFHMLARIGCYCKVMDLNLVKRPPNIAQTSNSLLLPTKSMIARGNQS